MLSIEREEFLDTIKKRDISRLKRFLEREPSLATTKDRDGVSAILVAIYYGNKEAADLIAAKKPELDVFEAASLGHLDEVKSLITRNRSRVNSFTPDGLTPLALAAFLGHDEVVEFLLHQGADVNVTEHKLGFNALTGAVKEGHCAASPARGECKLPIRIGLRRTYTYRDDKWRCGNHQTSSCPWCQHQYGGCRR